MKKPVIICVDDEKIVLDSLAIELNNTFYGKILIATAENGIEALELVDDFMQNNYDIPLVISDYIMPEMYGDELLRLIKDRSPETKSILLTGQASLDGIENSIKWANLYRYIPKPWEKNDLKLTITAAFKAFFEAKILKQQGEMIEKLNSELEEKVENRTKKLQDLELDILSQFEKAIFALAELQLNSNHIVKNKIQRMRKYTHKILTKSNLSNSIDVNYGVLLSHLGCVNIDNALLERYFYSDNLSKNEIKQLAQSNFSALDSLFKIPCFSSVGNAVRYYFYTLFNYEKPFPIDISALQIAKIIKITFDYDKYIVNGMSSSAALAKMSTDPQLYQAAYLEALSDNSDEGNPFKAYKANIPKAETKIKSNIKAVKFKELAFGMLLADSIYDTSNMKLVSKGLEISDDLINSLIKYNLLCEIKEPIFVYG
jgi:YesN/AraC family two-component response regulator